MRVVDLIRRKRDSGELTREEIEQVIAAYTAGEVPDYQMSAWLMAVVLRGMTRQETAALTEAMLHSGSVLDFSDLLGKKVDKHSTGGVGDKTSLVIAPIVAAGGLKVPMISGRGLGHSGGTLDKLESIPGFNVNLSLADFRRVLATCGCSLIGQTAEIAPADKKIYALRDVTGTVESPSLICASIMSKKLAEGIDALVLDVKTGSGAFMKNIEDAANLAELLVETGKRMGKKVVALLTDMNQPLGRKAGNAMEVVESIEVLGGAGPPDLRELCLELSAWMFVLGERVKTLDEGKKLSADLIASGQAREKFREIVGLQGGDTRVVDDPHRLSARPADARHHEYRHRTATFPIHIANSLAPLASSWAAGAKERKTRSTRPSASHFISGSVGRCSAASRYAPYTIIRTPDLRKRDDWWRRPTGLNLKSRMRFRHSFTE